MGQGVIEEIWELNERELFRQMIHDEVDKWGDKLLEVFKEDRRPTLMDLPAIALAQARRAGMSEIFTKTRQKFLGSFL